MTPLKKVVEATATAQMRRVTIPKARRQKQVSQTLLGVVAGLAGMFVVRYFALGEGWYVAAVLLGARIASREFLLDCLKIAREVLGMATGGGRPSSPEPDARTDDERGA